MHQHGIFHKNSCRDIAVFSYGDRLSHWIGFMCLDHPERVFGCLYLLAESA